MDGILVVNKPKGPTSHDIVDLIRKKFLLKKVGHAGTLDPMATGVLVMLIGKYTKSSGIFMSDDKEYEGSMVLGGVSDTGDALGNIKYSGLSGDFNRGDLDAVFKKFTGAIEQSPPMYSSVRFEGRKLYELAREGIVVKTKPRKVFIKELEVYGLSSLSDEPVTGPDLNCKRFQEVSFRVVCSKGTYIRQLCADIGDNLGCGAYLSRLNRTRSGRFSINDSIKIDELNALGKKELEKRLVCPC